LLLFAIDSAAGIATLVVTNAVAITTYSCCCNFCFVTIAVAITTYSCCCTQLLLKLLLTVAGVIFALSQLLLQLLLTAAVVLLSLLPSVRYIQMPMFKLPLLLRHV